MADVTGASLAPIYSRLNNAPTYHPLEADTFADWSVEAGDIVTVTRDDKSYQSPVHSSTITWKKGAQVSISSTGRQERESIARMSSRKFSSGSGGGGLRNSQYQHLYVEDQYKQMKAGLELSTSHVSLYIQDNYNQMKSGLYLTSSSAALYVDNKYSQMRAGLNLTSSSAALYVQDNYKQLRSGLALTSSSAALYVENKYTQMRSGLDMTSSSAALYVDNKYNQMRSGLDLTSSSASLYVDNKYNQIKSGLNLTSSSAALYVDNKYNQMKSGLNLTSSSAALYVRDNYNQMKSGLNLTSSSAALYVDNKYNQMKSGLNITSSSAALYAGSATNAAQIVARINNSTGESEIKLDANRVYIGTQKSTTVINGKLNASDVTAEYINGKIATIANMTVQSISSERGGLSMYSVATTNFSQGDVSCYVPNAIWTLRIQQSGNTYTLQRKRFNDDDWTDVGSFSRAVTDIGYQWGSNNGKLTVTAYPQNYSKQIIGVTTSGNWSGNTYNGKVKYYEGNDDEHTYDTGVTFTVTAPSPGSAIDSVDCTSPVNAEDTYGHKNTSGSGNAGYYHSGNTWGIVVKCKVMDANGVELATKYNYLEASPEAIANAASGGGDSYTRYTFSKTRTASSDGYHYTFSIGTGWQTPFGGDGGTYYLYKKD